MTIEEYLAELKRSLRAGLIAKHRVLREVRGHLLDAAAREGDVEAAIASFGAPVEVALRFNEQSPGRRRRVVWAATAAALAGGVAAGLVLSLGGSKPSVPIVFVRAAESACNGRSDCVDILTQRLVDKAHAFVQTICGAESADRQCVESAKRAANDAVSYVPCSEIPGMVYVGGSTWRLHAKKDGIIFDVCSEASG
jgi:hypothetical protein